jgi:hypothetical protein
MLLPHALRTAGKEEVPGTPDPYFNQTVLLLPGNGTNGAQNNTFNDSSTNNFAITRNGNSTQGAFSPFSLPDGKWSNFFIGGYLSVPDNTALRLGTGPFTIEAWIYRNVVGATHSIAAKGDAATNAGYNFIVTSTNVLRFVNGSTNIDTTTTIGSGWTHVAAVREGTGTNQFKLYINGVLSATSTVSTDFNQTNTQYIGANRTPGSTINGYISNFRIVKGTAVYTSNFTPPQSPLTAITNTSILTCQSNRFVDNSSNNFGITQVNTVRIDPFSVFQPSAIYSPSTNGGSGYFDGTEDYLQTASDSSFALGTGDFSISFWLYPTTSATVTTGVMGIGPDNTSRSLTIFSKYPNFNNNVLVVVSYNGSQVGTNTPTKVNAWNYVAISRSSGTLSIYLNGNRVAEALFNASNDDLNGTIATIGRSYYNANKEHYTGYISNLRIVKGTALYSGASISVPTAPETNVANTSLLLNFTNAGIIDNTQNNTIETVGNAQISTTVKKYGTGSIAFDGTGDYLVMPASDQTRFGIGNFTIEGWVYLVGTTNPRRILTKGNTSTSDLSFAVNIDTSWRLQFIWSTNGGSAITLSTPNGISGDWVDTWRHFAITRDGTNIRIFLNGVLRVTGSQTGNFYSATTPLLVGVDATGASTFNGYMDDLRITKGIARYTADFTPPTEPYPLF